MDQLSAPPSPDDTDHRNNISPIEQVPEDLIQKPDHVPDKFWNPELGSIRTDDLLKSYGELERRFGDAMANIPETPDEYQLSMPSEHIRPDQEVNDRLHAAGFTQEQTQLVYDLAYEKLVPFIEHTTAELHQEAAINQLESHFGGKAKWQETSRQLKQWGQANLPADTYESLSSSFDGILVMHRMMQPGEPSLAGNQTVTPAGLGEKEIKQMMRDPRYWRDQDPAFVEQVRKGFQSLYPD